jgi:hypothetical protein
MSVLGISVVIPSVDREAAVQRYKVLLDADVVDRFSLPGGSLTVTVLPGISILSGDDAALHPVRDLRATIFVDSLALTRERLRRAGWAIEGSLGPSASLLVRDSDGYLFELVERPENDVHVA